MQRSQIGPENLCPSSARGALTLLVIGRGEVRPTRSGLLSAPGELFG
jgi:hypothetical protein